MNYRFDYSTCFDDVLYRQTFARNYNLDPDKDLDLLKEIHSIATVKNVYDAEYGRIGSVIEYLDKIKNFVTSERYRNINEAGKRRFENHVFEILKGIVKKYIGTEYFITNVPSKTNVNKNI